MKAFTFAFLSAVVAFPCFAAAQTAGVVPGSSTPGSAPSNAQGDVSVTIYSNIALVRDVREMTIPEGRSRQEFADVSAQIRPETVTLGGEGIGIIEQNFDYDLLSPAALMNKAVGQQVTLLRTNPATGAETRERALVLAANGGVVLKIGERIEVLRDDSLPVRVIFDTIPANLRARPTLSVTLQADRAGRRAVNLSYLTQGMGWKADYVALFDEAASRMDVQGWVTLTNNTGTTFTNVRTLLVAGNVAPARQYSNNQRPIPSRSRGSTSAGTQSNGGEALGDLRTYLVEGRTTIANAQTKQVSFLNAAGVSARKGYEFRNEWLGQDDEASGATSIVRLTNARDTGVGAAMPAGVVRVYMRDSRGQAQFIGESNIDHMPAGSLLSLTTGDAFDVKVRPVIESRKSITTDQWEASSRWRVTSPDGQITQSKSERPKTMYQTQMRYIVTNARSIPVKVDVVQNLQGGWMPDVRVPTESIVGTQEGTNTRRWEVPVAANGTTELTVTFLTPW
jgi:hypothetical protein